MSKKDKTKNTRQVVKGKVKEALGKTYGDQKLEADGQNDQMMGKLKQAGEKVKDALRE